MSNRLGNTKVASRYAKALFDSVADTGELDTVAKDLTHINELLSQIKDLNAFIENPAIPQDAKIQFVDEQLAKSVNPWVGRLLRMLTENKRLPVFPQLVEHFTELLNRRENVTRAEVVTAVELEEELRARIAKSLEAALGYSRVEVQNRVDPGILGGAIIKVQDRVIDGSYIGRLEELRKKIAQV